MDCAVCAAYLREKRKCPGCRGGRDNKPNSCVRCVIINCKILKDRKMKYCSDKCKKFPCERLESLDHRYRTKYDFSMLDNLAFIEKNGIKAFTASQEKKYIGKNKVFCIHSRKYMVL